MKHQSCDWGFVVVFLYYPWSSDLLTEEEQDFRKIVAALICSIDFVGSVTGVKFVDRFVDSGVNQF